MTPTYTSIFVITGRHGNKWEYITTDLRRTIWDAPDSFAKEREKWWVL